MNTNISRMDTVELAGVITFLYAHGLDIVGITRIGNEVKMEFGR